MTRRLLIAAAVCSMLAGAAHAGIADVCSGEAYRHKHEQCIREIWIPQYDADFIRRNRSGFEDVIRSAIAQDWYDARQDWMRAHPQNAVIGMSAEEVRWNTVWGPPWHINSTQTGSETREQWVYQWPEGGFMGFLYFENGRLIAIQREGAR